MEYLLSFALLVLNLIDYERDLGNVVFTIVSAFIFVLLFYFVHRKNHNFLATCIVMMCHTWQISWVNIFGDPTEELQLPWFYLIGALILLYAVFNIGRNIGKGYNPSVLAIFFVVLIVFNYPLIISNSVTEGLKEYLMIGFFLVILFCAYIYKDEIPNGCHEQIKRAFIWASVISSVFLIFQYIMYSQFGVSLFKVSISRYFNNYQISYRLLMEDHSSATIMLGCSVFYIADRINKKNWYINVPCLVVVLVALALTSRRTSTITLAVVAVIYILFHFKGLGKKFVFTMIFGVGLTVMLYYLLIVRPVENISQVLSDNGRFANYAGALKIIADHPLGVGYDSVYIASMMPSNVIPHNTLMRWLCMGGYLFAVPLVILIVYVIRIARRKKMPCEFWALFYAAVASNFIPDLLNARFFIIPCAVVFLVDMRKPPELTDDDEDPDGEEILIPDDEQVPEEEPPVFIINE